MFKNLLMILSLSFLLLFITSVSSAQDLQTALNSLNYTINSVTDQIIGEVFFKVQEGQTAIVFQESSQSPIEAFGIYRQTTNEMIWLIGGSNTGFPMSAPLPEILDTFNLVYHPNYTGTGFLDGPYFSNPSLNSGGVNRAKVYRTSINNQIIPFSYIICWENWIDADYQDMIVRIDGVEAIPAVNQPVSPGGIISLTRWELQNGGNGHWYGIMPTFDNWQNVIDKSSAIFQDGMPGYPATITSQDENDFIYQNLIAGIQNPSVLGQFYLGGYYLNGMWYWINHEMFIYEHWSPGEPNNLGTEDIITSWGDFSPDRPAGYWNNVMSNSQLWSIIEWDAPQYTPPQVVSINGSVLLNETKLENINVSLYSIVGEKLASTYTDQNGSYAFENIPSGNYFVELKTPLGYLAIESDFKEISLTDSNIELDFALKDMNVENKPKNIYWWNYYLSKLSEDPYYPAKFTITDVNFWGSVLFDHFFDRTDGYGIQIEKCTYDGTPATALDFDRIVEIIVNEPEKTYEIKARKQLLLIMLNIVSGRLNQTKTVSQDGATVSQALTYFSQLYMANCSEQSDYETAMLRYIYVSLKFLLNEEVIPEGKIPLSTPQVLYKDEIDSPNQPVEYALSQNYPNPFNPLTTIQFNLPKASQVKLEIFNILGQKVETLTDQYYEAGYHELTWDAYNMATGVYLYRIEAGDFINEKKMVLMK